MARPWFGPKRFGWGLTPVSWEGWALTGAYIALIVTLGSLLAPGQPWLFGAIFAVVTALYLLAAFLTRD
jgi:hypothetical protein